MGPYNRDSRGKLPDMNPHCSIDVRLKCRSKFEEVMVTYQARIQAGALPACAPPLKKIIKKKGREREREERREEARRKQYVQ